MKILILLFGLSFISSLASPTHAQGNSISPCLPVDTQTMVWTADGEQPVRLFNADELAAIEGTQVIFQGYAGDGPIADELESRGDLYPYGFKGINLHKVHSVGTLILERDYGDVVGRVEVNRYLDSYLISFTTLDQYAVAGSYYDYHILPNPDGGACMWRVEAESIEGIFGICSFRGAIAMAVNAQEGDFLLYDTGYSEPIALQRASAVAVILPLTDLNAATRGFIVQARHGENWYTLRGDSEVTDLTDSTGTALLSGTVVFALPADIYPLGNIRIATVSSNTTLAIQTHSGTVTCGLFLKET